jgi:hypothetical protein
MSVDYIVASLPALQFDAPAPIEWEKFVEACGGEVPESAKWRDLETQLRNAVAEARGGAKYARPAAGCSLYWRGRIAACFQEKDVAQRDRLLDKVWWDAAEELTPPASPLGRGALATYAVRLRIAIKRSAISKERGGAAFDAITAGTKVEFPNS